MTRFIQRYLSFHFALWMIIPALLITSLPFDVVEIVSWGQQWQWGYYKHPPLPAWLLYPFYQLFGYLGPFLLSQLSIALTLACVYQLGLRLFDKERALFGCFALLGIYYFTFPSLEFNHNLGQMPIWAACVLFFERAIHTWSWPYWLLLGLTAAAGLLMKYSTLMLLASMFFYLLTDQQLRRKLFDIKVLSAFSLMILLLLPHLYWLHQHHYLPFHYAAARAASTGKSPLLNQFKFLLSQLLDHLPLIAALIIAGFWRPACWGHRNKHQRFLLFLGLGPVILTLLAALLSHSRIHTMWGAPMWNLSGLLIASMIKPDALKAGLSRFVYSLSALVFLISMTMAAYLQFASQLQKKPSRTDWPAKAMALAIDQEWQRLSSCPLEIVVGNYWLAGLISLDSQFRPSVFISANQSISPWIKADHLNRLGAITLWQDDEPKPQLADLDKSMHSFEGQMTFKWPKSINYPPLSIHWEANIPSHCLKSYLQGSARV